jgi:8-oxo-dGTP diphosphatase
MPTPIAARLVVGAALLRNGRVLAARRTTPPAAAGRWELPGGKVEPGETPEEALVREIAEELGCRVAVVGWLAGSSPISDGLRLEVARVDLVDGEPDPVEHDRVRWLTADRLEEVDWLDSDRPFLAELGELLRNA